MAWVPERIADPTAHWYYLADPHWLHTNIIRLCHRPFPSVRAMDVAILTAMREIEATDPQARIVVAGDASFLLPTVRRAYGWLDHPQRHVIVMGNHDDGRRFGKEYAAMFGVVIGTEKSWHSHSLVIADHDGAQSCDVLVSHDPLPDLRGCAWNVHGHFHDNLLANPGNHDLTTLGWLLDSTRHLNASVECIEYTPKTLAALVASQGHAPLWERIPDLSATRSPLPFEPRSWA
ncbi:hypothetical protein [Gemmatimonas sp.]|jgi:calcineurin-like phosphoesterase family protein|uniref:hypothetical protein n=1 Tax=Gemmatimonas sp. TaxID=1962908 RepID=UPI0037BE79A6